MNVNIMPNGVVQIDGARIIFRNFTGEASKYNKKGDRNFHIVIPTRDIADVLINDKNRYGVGWNVKIKDGREDEDSTLMTLPVKVKFDGARPPKIYLKSGKARVVLTEDAVSCLDDADIINVDLDIRPYDGEMNGDPFRSAYLVSMEVTQRIDRFAERYSEESEEGDEDMPF